MIQAKYEFVFMISLDPSIVLSAYRRGYFPMPHPKSQEIIWLNPDPRAILPLSRFHISKSLRKIIRKNIFTTTRDHDFEGVIMGCSQRKETWISQGFVNDYVKLHHLGWAHSLEVWSQDGELVGGLYGVSMGGLFCAESMFSTVSNASKVALASLVAHMLAQGMDLLEVQFLTPHLESLGAIEIPKEEYLRRLHLAIHSSASFSADTSGIKIFEDLPLEFSPLP